MNTLYSPKETSTTYTPSMFQLRGRIGRVRYLAYSFGLGVLVAAAMMLLMSTAVSDAGKSLAENLGLGASFIVSLIVGVRRLHDLGRSGWFALGLVIPFVNVAVGLWLLFAAGNPGANQYGPPPPANTRGVIAVAWIVPVVFIAGIVMAIMMAPQKSSFERARDEMEQAI